MVREAGGSDPPVPPTRRGFDGVHYTTQNTKYWATYFPQTAERLQNNAGSCSCMLKMDSNKMDSSSSGIVMQIHLHPVCFYFLCSWNTLNNWLTTHFCSFSEFVPNAHNSKRPRATRYVNSLTRSQQLFTTETHLTKDQILSSNILYSPAIFVGDSLPSSLNPFLVVGPRFLHCFQWLRSLISPAISPRLTEAMFIKTEAPSCINMFKLLLLLVIIGNYRGVRHRVRHETQRFFPRKYIVTAQLFDVLINYSTHISVQ